jgi:hypothetical protein
MGLGIGIGCEDFGASAAHAANRNGMAKAIKRTGFLLVANRFWPSWHSVKELLRKHGDTRGLQSFAPHVKYSSFQRRLGRRFHWLN